MGEKPQIEKTSQKSYGLFKVKTEIRHTSWNPHYELDFAQCPVCKRWFNYFTRNDFRGVKLHIRKWATKEATAMALGEITKMPHLDFWRDNTEIVAAIPKIREWTI